MPPRRARFLPRYRRLFLLLVVIPLVVYTSLLIVADDVSRIGPAAFSLWTLMGLLGVESIRPLPRGAAAATPWVSGVRAMGAAVAVVCIGLVVLPLVGFTIEVGPRERRVLVTCLAAMGIAILYLGGAIVHWVGGGRRPMWIHLGLGAAALAMAASYAPLGLVGMVAISVMMAARLWEWEPREEPAEHLYAPAPEKAA